MKETPLVKGGQVAAPSIAATGKARSGSGPTLHQMRIFSAVARAKALTRAAKDLGLSQPTLSLQLGKLETTVGARLFNRRPGEMELTEAGQFFLPLVDGMLRLFMEAEAGLAQFAHGYQPVLRIVGVDSALGTVLPAAIRRMQPLFADVSFDIRETAPAEAIELVLARRAHVGLVAATSLGAAQGQLKQVPVIDDPYVLAVPDFLDLGDVDDPARLPERHRAVLRRSVHFVFGSAQTNRIDEWYDRLLPGHLPVAQCRSFETALGFVRAGVGVCLAPALSAAAAMDAARGVRCYRMNVPPRQIVALVLPQQRRTEPVATLLAELASVGAAHAFADLLPTPRFLDADLLS